MKYRDPKVILPLLLCTLVLFGAGIYVGVTYNPLQAPPRASEEHISSPHTELESWSYNSEAKETLIAYVQDVTQESSPHFIPTEERVATFDLDGTLYLENQFTYFDLMALLNWALNEPQSHATDQMKTDALSIQNAAQNNAYTAEIAELQTQLFTQAFNGVSRTEFMQYIDEFAQTPADGFHNLLRKDAFYLPMKELVHYLQEHDFQIYIVSAAVRDEVRVLVCKELDIPADHVIGADYSFYVAESSDASQSTHLYEPHDTIRIGSELVNSNEEESKALSIVREIGKTPVMAFGNSSGDYSMLNLAIDHPRYPGIAFVLNHDDDVREYGKPGGNSSLVDTAQTYGWHVISMKNDFNTVFEGDASKAS